MEAISLSVNQFPSRYHSLPAITSRLWRRSETDEQEIVFRYRGPPRRHFYRSSTTKISALSAGAMVSDVQATTHNWHSSRQ
ncbi:MAG TPA: hypothetical protein PLN21_15855 [Gemmatales bacterium]|nr:hypothetical protein [Gemmatales bacterium]